MKLIVQNGVDVNPLYKDRILFSNFYEGRVYPALASASLAAGGQLILGNTYYYKVVCVCDKYVVLSGDTATQLSNFDIDIFATNFQKLTWSLHDDAGVRVFELWNGNTKVARGFRTGDGSLSFDEIAESGVRGTVTVTYSATDADPGNTIIIERDVVIQSAEVHEHPLGADLKIQVGWTPPIDNVKATYLYRGTTTGVYDGYFLLAGTAASFTDDGTRSFDFDASITTENVVAHREFLPEGYVGSLWHPCSSRIAWRFTGDHFFNYIDCTKVINKPTWNAATEVANITAFNEFSTWI